MDKYKFVCGCEVDIISQEQKNGLPKLKIDYEKIFYDLNYNKYCPLVVNMLAEGKTKGVFQLEGYLGKNWSEKLQPSTLEETAALVALIRPSALQSVVDGKNMTQHYVDRKHGVEPVESFHKSLGNILSDTYEIFLFQEQALTIVKELAGFTEEESETLRKAIGTKKADIMAEVKKDFIIGCKKIGKVNEEEAEKIFGWIQEAQRYQFNKCFSGQEKIKRRNKSKYGYHPTIEEMYHIRNNIEYAKKTGHLSLYKKWKRLNNYGYGLSLDKDGRVKPNIIKDIRYQGKRKTYKISTSSGSVVVTGNHKFPTPTGEKRCDELSVEDSLYICGKYEQTKNNYNWSQIKRNNKIKMTYQGCGFPKATKNPKYTNGSYTDFRKNKKLLPQLCQICNKKPKRIECHHIDGNRENSKIENLINLCSSCHKKEEYKNGRLKQGEKGYPSYQEKIINIEYYEEENVYDVEMESPNHTLTTEQNIITCNSHATSYGQMSYVTCWAKAHFPIQFFASYLTYAKDKLDHVTEIKELVDEAKKFNIPVLTASLNTLLNNDLKVCIDNKKLRFGLRSMKSMGDSAIEKIIKVITEKETLLNKQISNWNWTEILYYLLPNINLQNVNALITGGVLDGLGKSRSQMLLEFQKIKELSKRQLELLIEFNLPFLEGLEKVEEKVNKGQKQKIFDLRTLVENSTHSMSDRIGWIISSEKDIYGVSVTYNPVDVLKNGSNANTTCKEFISGKDGNLSLAGELENVRKFKIKNGKNAGKMMATGKLNDGTGIIDCILFQKNYDDFEKTLENNNLVCIFGKRSDSNSLIIDNIQEIY